MLAGNVYKLYLMIHIISEISLKDYKNDVSLEIENLQDTSKDKLTNLM